jgi:hypothetical protein
MNIILTCIGNFQDYILTNIKQLLRLKHNNIYVICDYKYFKNFEEYKEYINLVDIETLPDMYNYKNKSNLDKNFRNGFWMLTSYRFFAIYSLMKKYELTDVIHLENDVLIYENIHILKENLNNKKLYVPFDTFERNIASIMYIPNSEIFGKILEHYDHRLNDMENFSFIQKETEYIENFPIFKTKDDNEEYKFITKNFDKFNIIFDAAAIGQYLGGVDPRNISGDTTGFINETCIIKYNNYKFFWEEKDDIKRPYLILNDELIPIFNLHIHCKNLIKFL